MNTPEGARSFLTSGAAYDGFMGRYSKPLAEAFAESAGVRTGMTVLDLGCGPGALTGVLSNLLGADSVSACDPSPPFVEACAYRHPGVDVRRGAAEAIPFEAGTFDAALAQLVLHFVDDPSLAAAECRRVLKPGGVIAACVWDRAKGMEMLRHFWKAAFTLDADIPAETTSLRFGRPGEIAELLEQAGFIDVRETTLAVSSTYADFDELWSGFQAGIGPAGVYCQRLEPEAQTVLRRAVFERLGSPAGPFSLDAWARSASGRLPE